MNSNSIFNNQLKVNSIKQDRENIRFYTFMALTHWIKNDTSHLNVITCIFNNKEELNPSTNNFTLLPDSIKKLILDPFKVIPSLDKSISTQQINTAIRKGMYDVTVKLAQENTNKTTQTFLQTHGVQPVSPAHYIIDFSNEDKLQQSISNLSDEQINNLLKAIQNVKNNTVKNSFKSLNKLK